MITQCNPEPVEGHFCAVKGFDPRSCGADDKSI